MSLVASDPSSALIVGATGLVGGKLLEKLLAASEYAVVRALVRRPCAIRHSKLEIHQVDFERPEDWEPTLEAAHVFCCLGTTLKKAGSQQAFRHVDHDLPLDIARRARRRGATGLFVISALGADPRSAVFYNRVKGELERDLQALEYPTLGVFRPSLLSGERREQRLSERLAVMAASAVTPMLAGSLRRYRVISADDVAQGMLTVGKAALGSRDPLGFAIYESDAIAKLAKPGQR